MSHGHPTYATGKICYLEIPAIDAERSSRFYQEAFGWHVRKRGDGQLAFDDTVGHVSGTWVTDRAPSRDPGTIVYVMSAEIGATLTRVREAGGEIERDVDPHAPERFAHVLDIAGNLIGVYEQPGLAAREHEVSPVPEHLHTVTPRLIVGDASAAIDFYKAAFGATDIGERHFLPDGTLIHAEIRIGDSVVMLSDGEGNGDLSSSLMCTYWAEVDAVWERAIAAGAEVIYPLADQSYGERGGRLGDPFGQQWMLSARIENLTAAEIAARGAEG